MRNSIKYLLTMILGGVIAGSILIVTGVNAQNEGRDEFETVAPTIADATLSIDSIFQYQGQLLSSNGTPINGVLPMTFRIYKEATGGAVYWGQAKSVTVSDGWFTAPIGDDSGNPISDELLNGDNLWLGVQVSSDAETSPRQPIRPAMFAVNSRMLNGHTADHFLKADHGPVAYGIVGEDGSERSGYNFSSEHNGNQSRYEITITDHYYDLPSYSTIVTALEGSSCPHATIGTTNATTDGRLIVYLHKTDGNFTKCDFSFVTIKN